MLISTSFGSGISTGSSFFVQLKAKKERATKERTGVNLITTSNAHAAPLSIRLRLRIA
jgi:hypothetical protein